MKFVPAACRSGLNLDAISVTVDVPDAAARVLQHAWLHVCVLNGDLDEGGRGGVDGHPIGAGGGGGREGAVVRHHRAVVGADASHGEARRRLRHFCHLAMRTGEAL